MSIVINVPIIDSWTDINTSSGIPVGAAFQVVNGSNVGMLIAENPVEPAEAEGFPLRIADSANVIEGSNIIWVKTSSKVSGVHVSVQEL